MKKVLITGGAGFLGSHLCDMFLDKGFYVIAMDNLITGNISNIEHLFNKNNFEFINHNIIDEIKISHDLDYILNFASPASPIDYLKIPIETMKVGSVGALNCLNLAKEKNARILIASTSEIYGDPLVHPQHEDYYGNVNSIGPRSVYDEAKRFMESLTMAFHNKYGLETRIVRIFNTYGPRMRLNDGRALPTFMGQALKNNNLTIFGDGTQTRSFCFISDLIDGIFKILLSKCSLPINLGNSEEVTLNAFAKEIISLVGSNSKIEYLPLPENDPKIRRPDISKAKEILSWEPKVNRKKGLYITYNYFKKIPKKELNLSPRKF